MAACWSRACGLASLRGGLYTIAWVSVILYVLLQVLMQVSTWVWRDDEDNIWEKLRVALNIPYNVNVDSSTTLLGGWDAQFIVVSYIPIALAAICATAAACIPARWPASTTDKSATAGCGGLLNKLRRACSYQVAPRGFWMRWCDGLNALEATLWLAWAATHIVIVWDVYLYFAERFDAWEEQGLYYPAPKSVIKLEYISLAWSWCLWIDFAILFMPLSHNSFLNHLFGQSYASFVRFHRWIGHWALISTTLHGLFYYFYWLCDPNVNFWEAFFDWSTLSAINYLAGTIAWLFLVGLWVTSLEYVRRNYFEVFYKTHITCFFGFVLLAHMHLYWMWPVMLPALLLYAADVVVRVGQAQKVTVLASEGVGAALALVGDGTVAALKMPVAKDAGLVAGNEVYLLAPSISRWQWHPFTVADVRPATASAMPYGGKDYLTEGGDTPAGSDDAHQGPMVATIAIKATGSWSQALLQALAARPLLPVRVMGPFGPSDLSDKYASYPRLLLVAGGIGVSPVLALLKGLAERRNAGSSPVPQRVVLVWAARHPQEFTLLNESLAAAAASPSDASHGDGKASWLDIQLYSTAPPNPTPDEDPKPAGAAGAGAGAAAAAAACAGAAASKCPISDTLKWASSGSKAMGAPVLQAARTSSGWLHSLVRPMQPQLLSMGRTIDGSLGHTQRLLVLLVTMLGALMGLFLAQAVYIEMGASGSDWIYWQVGAVYVCLVGLQMVGLPMITVIFPIHLYRHLTRKDTGMTQEDVQMLSSHERKAPCVVGGTLTYPETGLAVPLLRGRPSLRRAVECITSDTDLAAGCVMAVVAAGPELLNEAVHAAVEEANALQRTLGISLRLEYHQETHQL